MTVSPRKPFNRTMLAGLLLLSLANFTRWVLERHSSLPEGPRDAVFGLLIGAAIGCLVLGIWKSRRNPSDPDRSSCA
jgi:hypothetical protein